MDEFNAKLLAALKADFNSLTQKAILWAMTGESEIAKKYLDLGEIMVTRIEQLEAGN